jgi:G:T-mismatch repair DNA endonuclease (very short patch repair protein)
LRDLAHEGWKALVIWQCELKDTHSLTEKLQRFLGSKGCSTQ